MMYNMKNIITHDGDITLPECMYRIKNPIEAAKPYDIDINISNQVMKFLKIPKNKMTELEQRQDQLLKKLDFLYEKIKEISSFCAHNRPLHSKTLEMKQVIPVPNEIVISASAESLPWFLNVFLKESSLPINITWHIHSSVPNEKVPKIKAFMSKLHKQSQKSEVNLRLLFKGGAVDSELKLSSLAVPIVGNVNILRYLALVYPNVAPYDYSDYNVDSLLDQCHLLEKTGEKNKEALLKKIFSQCNNWIYKNEYSVVDIAVYNVIKQWQNSGKFVPKSWYNNCEKICL